MTETTEVSVKLALCVLAAGVVVFRHVRAELRDERAGVVLAFVAFVAGLAYYNFRTFHGDSSVHAHEQFHYFLGSKYFPELGYDGLYAASIAAERHREPDAAIQDFIQDLRINRVRRTDDLKAHESEVVARFRTPGRDNWDPFATDNGYFLETNDAETISAMRLDHGFNGTPTWAFVGRLFSSSLPASEGTFLLLSNLDNLLLAAAFLAIFAAYGGRVGCLSVIVFGLAYASRYYWVGGGFLRQDWLAATVIGVCLLKLGRPASAGAALGYAAMVRIFPVLFLVGPILVAVRGSLDGDSRSLRRLCGGFFVAVILGVAAGCFVGRGVGAWSDFARNIELQRTTWLTNSVGLTTALVQNSGTLDERYVDRSASRPLEAVGRGDGTFAKATVASDLARASRFHHDDRRRGLAKSSRRGRDPRVGPGLCTGRCGQLLLGDAAPGPSVSPRLARHRRASRPERDVVRSASSQSDLRSTLCRHLVGAWRVLHLVGRSRCSSQFSTVSELAASGTSIAANAARSIQLCSVKRTSTGSASVKY